MADQLALSALKTSRARLDSEKRLMFGAAADVRDSFAGLPLADQLGLLKGAVHDKDGEISQLKAAQRFLLLLLLLALALLLARQPMAPASGTGPERFPDLGVMSEAQKLALLTSSAATRVLKLVPEARGSNNLGFLSLVRMPAGALVRVSS